MIAEFDQAFDTTPLQIRYPSQDTPQRDIGFHDDSYAYATVGEVGWFFWNRVLSSGAELNWTVGLWVVKSIPLFKEEPVFRQL